MFKKGFIAGLVCAVAFMLTVAAASPILREVSYSISVNFNGSPISFPEDSRPFLMNSRAYLPVRTIADLLGLDVDFADGVVYLAEKGTLVLPPSIAGSNTFTHQEFGLMFTHPDDWNKTADGFSSPSGATVRFSSQELPHFMTDTQYIETAVVVAIAAGIDVDFGEGLYETTQVGNHRWASYRVKMPMQILDRYMSVVGYNYVNIQNDVARMISIITTDASESIDEILEMFSGV